MRPTMSEEELKWRRRDDAYTLARAEQIKADKERYQGAILGAKEIASEEIERVKGIAKVAGMQTPKAPAKEVVVEKTTPQVVPTCTVTPQFAPRRSNPATIGRF